MEKKIKTFKIIEVKEITASNGNKFTGYKTIGTGNRKLDVRFTKAVPSDKLPKEPCLIKVCEEDANVDKSRVYPILWIKAVQEIVPFTRNNNLSEFFG